jgi:Ca2+-binding EF-hand superfamily protein
MDRREALKEKFQKLDKNRDNFLSLEELSVMLKKGNPKIKPESIKRCFDKVAGADGKVSLDEFVDYLVPTELDLIKYKLPSDSSKKSQDIRKALFSRWDQNGNQILSLAEIDNGIREELGIGNIGPSGLDKVLLRAYQVARDFDGGVDMTKIYGMAAAEQLQKADIMASTINRKEFRVYCEYILHYFVLFSIFKSLDKTFDGKIGPDEFAAGKQEFIQAGFHDCKFEDIDLDGQGSVLFDEFSTYLIGAVLQMDHDDD